jgi:hypothetical protein
MQFLLMSHQKMPDIWVMSFSRAVINICDIIKYHKNATNLRYVNEIPKI